MNTRKRVVAIFATAIMTTAGLAIPVTTDNTASAGTTIRCLRDKPTLKPGSHHHCVWVAQKMLQYRKYYFGKLDGDFGPATQRAVNDWRLVKDGRQYDWIVDRTWRQLCASNACLTVFGYPG